MIEKRNEFHKDRETERKKLNLRKGSSRQEKKIEGKQTRVQPEESAMIGKMGEKKKKKKIPGNVRWKVVSR